MHFAIPTLLAALAALTSAAPSAALDARQQGGHFVAVGDKFSAGGCNPSQEIFADPIFGDGNVCQALDRSGTGVAIVSYKTLSVEAGCSVKLYTTRDCTGTAYSAPVGGCVTGSAPFVSTFVTCVR